MLRITNMLFSALTAAILLAFSGSALAAKINLYDSPTDTAKITGTIDLAAGIIPIFTPPNSTWTKVADPANGNTGWVKNSELKDDKGNMITFQQKVGTDGQTKSVEISSSYGTPPTPEQKKTLEEQSKQNMDAAIQLQNQANQLLNDAKKIYQQQMETMQKAGYPMVTLPGMNPQPTTPAAPATPKQ